MNKISEIVTCGCACGSVRFEFNSKLLNIVNCHCDACRKHNGSAFSSYVSFPHDSMKIVKGKRYIKSYQQETASKHFCSECGAPLYNTNSIYPGLSIVYLGALDAPVDYRPRFNIWCESQLGWVKEIDGVESLAKGFERKKRD